MVVSCSCSCFSLVRVCSLAGGSCFLGGTFWGSSSGCWGLCPLWGAPGNGEEPLSSSGPFSPTIVLLLLASRVEAVSAAGAGAGAGDGAGHWPGGGFSMLICFLSNRTVGVT